jgi:hypothetical protein
MRRRSWLVAAVVLFMLAAVVMLYGQGEVVPAPATVEVEFPRQLRPAEQERLQSRRTLRPVPPVDMATQGRRPPQPRDPVLAALPQGRGRTAVVLEANALRHSPVGALLLECINRQGNQGLERMRQELGVNPLEDFDRVVVTPEGMMVSGHFQEARWDSLLRDASSRSYGDKGRIFEQPARRRSLPDGTVQESRAHVMGVWDEQLVMFGESVTEVQQAFDRLEGRAAADNPAIREEQTFGDIYGVLSPEDLARLVPRQQAELVEQLRQVGAQVELHVDARSDLGMVAHVTGTDPRKLQDVGKAMGGALALGRLDAQVKGDERLASVLEFARVQPGLASFNLEMALPLSFLEEQLAFCRKQPDAGGP